MNADYKKATQGGKTMQGLFNVIYKSKEGKLLFEMPDTAFHRTYMLSSRVAATSDTQDYVAGQMSTSPILICFTKDERNVYLHKMQYMDMVVEGDPMASSFQKNFLHPILKAFKITATNGNNVVIDVTSFFGGNEKCIRNYTS